MCVRAATTTRWNDFNPDDIESLTVLKGPNAAALYGSRASIARGEGIFNNRQMNITQVAGFTAPEAASEA